MNYQKQSVTAAQLRAFSHERLALVITWIASHLEGKEWNADTCDAIARELRALGVDIEEPAE